PGRYDFSVMPTRADSISRSDNSRDQIAIRRRYFGVIISRFSSIYCNAADKRSAALKIAGELSDKRHSALRLYPMQIATPNGTLGVARSRMAFEIPAAANAIGRMASTAGPI